MNVIKTKNGQEVLLPKNDYLFKLIFGDKRNKHLLKGFLRAVLELPPDDFDVEFIDTHSKPDIEHKLCILDVRVITNTGKQIDIEMQVVQTEALFERICFYKSLMITEQLGSGMGYEQIKKVISIVIADFIFVEGGLPERYHHCFNFIDKADSARFGDVEEIHTIELPKLPEQSDDSAVWDWSKFIDVRSEEELDMLAVKNEEMREAVDLLRRLSAKDKVRREYEAREKAWRDERARERFAENKGRNEILDLLRGGASAEDILRKYGR